MANSSSPERKLESADACQRQLVARRRLRWRRPSGRRHDEPRRRNAIDLELLPGSRCYGSPNKRSECSIRKRPAHCERGNLIHRSSLFTTASLARKTRAGKTPKSKRNLLQHFGRACGRTSYGPRSVARSGLAAPLPSDSGQPSVARRCATGMAELLTTVLGTERTL